MMALFQLGTALVVGWALVGLVLACLIFPLPAADRDERKLAWRIVLGWPIIVALIICRATRADWRSL